MSPTFRFVLAGLAYSAVASSALGYPVSVSTSATSTAAGVLFSKQLTSFSPPEPTSLTVSDGYTCPTPPCLSPWVGSGEASADLAAGTLGVSVSGSHGDSEIYNFVAGASFTDTLVFHLPPAVPSIQITITMTIDADVPAQNINGRVGLGALIAFGQDAAFLNFPGTPGPAHVSLVMPITTTVEDGLPVVISASLNAALLLVQTDHGLYAIDAAHTAALSISLPAGVTYDSYSGVFLTQVDEPSLVHLLSSSALAVFAAVRPATKRRRIRPTGR